MSKRRAEPTGSTGRPHARRKRPPKRQDQINDAGTGVAPRALAIDAMLRIERDGAYANLVVGPMLERSSLDQRDRAFVTEMVYGATRMRRALDAVIDRFLHDDIDPDLRAALRIGTYQLIYLGTPAHAAVAATVGASRKRGRGLVNAVLRRIAGLDSIDWSSDAVRLSYPDWIVDTLETELGVPDAHGALEAMNQPAVVHQRADGYIQDPASAMVVDALGAQPGDVVVDLCAAPGGKATLLAHLEQVRVIAADRSPNRVRLMARNMDRTGTEMALMVADAASPPLRPGTIDRVLLDAPCSGLGSLRRRPDARWRIDADAPARLHTQQTAMVDAAIDLLRPGGVLLYSVCTLTAPESAAVLDYALGRSDVMIDDTTPWDSPDWMAVATTQGLYRILPGESDGMSAFRLRKH